MFVENRGQMNNNQRSPTGISIKSVSGPAFEAFLEYLYLGSLDLSDLPFKDILDFVGLANTYKVPGQIKPCAAYLEALLDLDNCVSIYLKTKGMEGMHDLTEKAFDMMMTPNRFHKILGNGKFLELDAEAVERILRLDDLEVREVDILLALLKWGFQFVAIGEFCTHPTTSRLLRLIRGSMLPPIKDVDISNFGPTSRNFVFTDVNAMKFIKKFAMDGFDWQDYKRRSSKRFKERNVQLYREVQVRHVSRVFSKEEFRLRQSRSEDALTIVTAVRLNTFYHQSKSVGLAKVEKRKEGKLTLTVVQGEEKVVGVAVIDIFNGRNESQIVKLRPTISVPWDELRECLNFNVELVCYVHGPTETCFTVDSGCRPLLKNNRTALNVSGELFLDATFPEAELNNSYDAGVGDAAAQLSPNFIKSVDVEFLGDPEPCRIC